MYLLQNTAFSLAKSFSELVTDKGNQWSDSGPKKGETSVK